MSRLINYYGDYDKPVPEHVGGEKREASCDIVIIGAGGSGLSAAVRAAEMGRKVILVDKMSEAGGDTRLAAGLLCTNSEVLKKLGVPDTTERHINDYRRLHHYRLDPAIYERFIRNTGRCYDWLVEKGLDTENRRMVMDNVVMIKDRKEWGPIRHPGYGPGLMGSAVTDILIRCVNENELIDLILSTKVTELITGEEGSVTGVRAVGQGIDWTIHAQDVILACGGFGCNTQMLKHYFPSYFTSDNYFTHYCLKHCTGDGIKMAQDIGAETGKNMSFGLEDMVHQPGAYTLQRVVKEPAGIIVSASGKRFISEDDPDNVAFAFDMQPDGLGWYLFSEAMKDKLYELALEHSKYDDWMPETEVYHEELEEELGTPLSFKADTIEELAADIGAPADVLAQTMKEYESFCKEGADHAFYKDSEHLISHGSEGPWYAVRLVRKFDVTMGGVSIDDKNHALRPDGSVIKGLYVCGDIASNWMGTDYGPFFSSFAWALNSGYLTAEEICRQSGKKKGE
ncbi:MAG: FAD-dependent oxidoreductase [Parasporobacterium sp.]|nr:FAD-dependent oxidoreductase [Parasporobacterium sp.]